MNVYKITDIITCEFLKIPKAMFANQKYRVLSSDAKLTYALLYDRLSLSKLNGWINEDDEVFLIYTREEVAEDLGISYKKAISAFKELTDASLITEQRCGRGMPNKIYIVKPELSVADAKEYVEHENLRTAKSACLENAEENEICENSISEDSTENYDMPNGNIKNFQNGTSRTAELEYQDMPNQHPNQTNINKTYNINTNNSQSVIEQEYKLNPPDIPGQADDETKDFEMIIKKCNLETFDDEEQKILYDALERMYYTKEFRIGDAVLPQKKVRSRMYELNGAILRSAIFNLHKNDRKIKNITGYVMSTIFNCITEEYSLLHVDPYLNAMRRKE